MVTDGPVGLDDRPLIAYSAFGHRGQWLILAVVDLPLYDIEASPAELVKRRVHDLLTLDRVLVVPELEHVLVSLSILPHVPLLCRHI